uniref:Si:dkeyp-9d4.4 n=1 Tax=Sinocyclocheilus grahami TaxID=75366 RepID=A0A672MFG8_SINGR
MALSQVQCLDDNHVNWRLNESKPEFFYSENQRLALEALITKGRDAFDAYMKEHELRPFLSEPELERLRRSIEDYKPGSEHQKPDGTTEGEDGAVSLQYWPDRSDISIPNLDLGWPDCNSYRGVTRVNVYTQPPMDGQTHIKEVVRKAIAQAQKMIAVVMDVFTDVDIFKDLIEAGFKKKVAIYIIIDYAALQHFLLIKDVHLRVRCIGGSEFYTHSAQKVQGSLGQKFMFVDGDRAVSGSYRFVLCTLMCVCIVHIHKAVFLKGNSDKLPNGRLTGSGRVGDHSPDALNMMARFSQSMLDLRSDDFKQNTAEKNLLNKQNRDKTKVRWTLF